MTPELQKKDLCTHYWLEKRAFSHHFVQLALVPEINYAACQQRDRRKTKCTISSRILNDIGLFNDLFRISFTQDLSAKAVALKSSPAFGNTERCDDPETRR